MVQKSFKRARCWRLDGSAHAKKKQKKNKRKKGKEAEKQNRQPSLFFVAADAARRYSLGVTAVGEALGEVEVD